MSPDPTNAPSALDAATRLAHRLIRAYAGDDFDPFMVGGSDGDSIERHCFYYSMLVLPTLTILFDNDGRGGMCELVPEQIGAVWITDTLLGALGTTLPALRDGSAAFGDVPVPAALYDRNAEVRGCLEPAPRPSSPPASGDVHVQLAP